VKEERGRRKEGENGKQDAGGGGRVKYLRSEFQAQSENIKIFGRTTSPLLSRGIFLARSVPVSIYPISLWRAFREVGRRQSQRGAIGRSEGGRGRPEGVQREARGRPEGE
jgi:hypothetical protein